MAAASFAAACCAGAGWALAALTAVGAGFLAHDAVLVPLFVAFVGLSLWLLYRSTRTHANPKPLYLAVAGSAAALVGLWTSVEVLSTGLGVMVAASLWDYAGSHARR